MNSLNSRLPLFILSFAMAFSYSCAKQSKEYGFTLAQKYILFMDSSGADSLVLVNQNNAYNFRYLQSKMLNINNQYTSQLIIYKGDMLVYKGAARFASTWTHTQNFNDQAIELFDNDGEISWQDYSALDDPYPGFKNVLICFDIDDEFECNRGLFKFEPIQ
jgi:hypothetical protein